MINDRQICMTKPLDDKVGVWEVLSAIRWVTAIIGYTQGVTLAEAIIYTCKHIFTYNAFCWVISSDHDIRLKMFFDVRNIKQSDWSNSSTLSMWRHPEQSENINMFYLQKGWLST